MDKYVIRSIVAVVILFIVLLIINLTSKTYYKNYIYNNIDNIKYEGYRVRIRVDGKYNDTIHEFKMIDSLGVNIDVDLNKKFNKSIVNVHLKKCTFNYLIDFSLEYSFLIDKKHDSFIVDKLKEKIIYQSMKQ